MLPAVLLLLPVACRSNQKRDLVEAELRTRERELAETRAELAQAKLFADAYQRNLQRQPADPGAAGPAPPLPIREIVLGNGTGGLDEDNLPGDEALQVVVVPRDDDGSSVKVPARLMVWAFEITREGLKNPIGTWDVTPEQLRRAWRSGLFATGYYVTLQWDKPPATDRLRVAVRLTTVDGRQFEADRDVAVRPILAHVAPTAAPIPTPASAPAPPVPAFPPPSQSTPAIPPPGLPRTQELQPEELPPPKTSFKRPAAKLLPPQAMD